MNLCSSCTNINCEFQSGITRMKCDFYKSPISRSEAIKAIEKKAKQIKNEDTLNGLAGAVAILFELPPVMQESGKSIVSVLEQISTEIKQSFDGYLVVDKNKDYASNTFKGQPAITINHVFEIIDKYKAESEE